MPADPIFQTMFSQVYGKPCWRVTHGHGSFLTFEFGDPHLEIREPIVPKAEVSPAERDQLMSRKVFIHGDWHLWIYCCAWRVLRGDTLVGDSSSSRAGMEQAADFLDGQKLLQFSITTDGVRCRFDFDLGGTLETWPYDNNSEQWLFFDGPTHKVLTLRADGYFSHHRSDQAGEEQWFPIQSTSGL